MVEPSSATRRASHGRATFSQSQLQGECRWRPAFRETLHIVQCHPRGPSPANEMLFNLLFLDCAQSLNHPVQFYFLGPVPFPKIFLRSFSAPKLSPTVARALPAGVVGHIQLGAGVVVVFPVAELNQVVPDAYLIVTFVLQFRDVSLAILEAASGQLCRVVTIKVEGVKDVRVLGQRILFPRLQSRGLELELHPEVRVEPIVDNVPVSDSELVASLGLGLVVAGERIRGVKDDPQDLGFFEILRRLKHGEYTF